MRLEFNQDISIVNKSINSNSASFIIAVVGLNHNSDLALAREMIDVAASCGVDAIKFR